MRCHAVLQHQTVYLGSSEQEVLRDQAHGFPPHACVPPASCVCLQKVCIQEDGVHLTPEGQKVMYKSIMNVIETKLPQIK